MNLIFCLSKGFKSAQFYCPFSGLEETQGPTLITPTLPSAQSFWGRPPTTTTHMQCQRVTSSQGCQVQFQLFLPPQILPSVPLVLWETIFLEIMLMGREGSGKRQRKAEEQTLKPSFWIYDRTTAVPVRS